MERITRGYVPNLLLFINVLMAIVYISWWFYLPHMGNVFLYALLFFGEIYHIIMSFGFWYTIWNRKIPKRVTSPNYFDPSVTVFITVAGEPVDIVTRTIKAAKEMNYPNFKVVVLNDGFVANKENWKEIERTSQDLGVECITRRIPGGAKAGNINNGLRSTQSELVAIFDADMIPNKDFLSKLVPYFYDEKVAFVQSPQFYKNFDQNEITRGAWEQQDLFFGPIMSAKDNLNSSFICGTNLVLRRKALEDVGGINEKSIAEDFLTSYFIHKRKWKSVYYPNILAEGLAPLDLLSYYKQQQRWARGSLEILFRYNPFFRRGFTFAQRVEYFLSALFYLNGLIVLIDIIMPILFLFFGLQPVSSTTQSFALYFIPYMFLNLYTIFLVSGGGITFRAISFSQASWFLQLSALFSLLTRRKVGFAVTSKKRQEGNYLFLIYPHLLYIVLAVIGIALNLDNKNPAVFTNSAWAIFNIIMFLPFIKAAYNWRSFFIFRQSPNIGYQE